MISHLATIALNSTIVFLVVLVGLRLLGKRHVAQLSLVDLVLILLISNTVQNAMVGDSSSLADGIVSAITLLGVSYLITFFLYKFKKAEQFVEGSPTLLIHNGNIIQKHLEQEKITEEELHRAMREHGIEQLTDIKSAIMEADGTISIIPSSEHHKTIETFKHRRSKYQPQRPT